MAETFRITLDGVQLEAAWWGTPDDATPSLVLLHEGLGSVGLWRDFPVKLAEATGCAVFAWSRSGYGRSDSVPLPRPLSYMHDEAARLGRVLDAAGIRQAILLGHSDGASIAAIYAGSVQDFRLRGLILIAPHFFVEDVSIASIAAARQAYTEGDLRPRLARYHSDVDAAFLGWNQAWLDPAFRSWDITDHLAYIRVPILLLQGSADPYGSTAQLHAAQTETYCPVECVLLPGIAHAPHLEAPDATLSVIDDFVRRVVALGQPARRNIMQNTLGDVGNIMHNLGRGNKPMNHIDFQTEPARYRHWRLRFDGPVAELVMDVDPNGGLVEGYELKLNSYDLGVDIELNDAVQRLRFEHPEVHCVVLRSGKDNVFCAGANIRMLGKSSHAHKVNFCKFTNETRMAIEDASEHSGQTYLCAVNGTAAGGGYELAVTAAHIMLIDDRRSTVSLPETPLLAVLPGTGGLTRLTDKRKVRRDRADVFCSMEEGVRGKRAVEWRLVDEVVPPSAWDKTIAARAHELAARSDRPADASGIKLHPLERRIEETGVTYSHVRIELDRPARRATLTVQAPHAPLPSGLAGIHDAGDQFWPLLLARELDDAILHLRTNEPDLGVIVLRSEGDASAVLAADTLLETHRQNWLVREIRLYLKRVLKRLDLTSRSLIALIEPGSCFAGTLAELTFAADRSVIFAGRRSGDNHGPAALHLSALNFGAYPMSNGLTRLQTRFLGEPDSIARAEQQIGTALDSEAAEELGLVTFAYDDTDWDDEVRMMLEERASFSPDALTGMEANLRFAGPETMETRIFGRLTAWQNWIFQRPNAVGESGALKRYGSGVQPDYNPTRV